MLGKYVNGRFRDQPYIAKPELIEYLYQNWTEGDLSGGGRMHATLLEPGAFARKPLCDRIPLIPVRTDFIYGTTDWMDFTCALALSPGEYDHAVMRVKDAGHNVMVDNPMGLVEAMGSCLQGDRSGHGAVFSGDSFKLNVFKLPMTAGAPGEESEE
eukprot:TRINITY_DN7606_c0_g2_i3.p1 TRINITY_DN7606_c0_g2~~TRINITY_DN7606_c0_g2_i3.p1  ORF type:complete len:156 (-),score=25.13 TRINITY_DN7606_c0_g2_i3:363-830(-)